MELRQYVRVLARFSPFIALLCASATISGVLLTYVISEKYRATAIVLVQPNDAIEMHAKAKELLGFRFPLTYNDPVKLVNQTYSEIIESRGVAQRVVEQLGLDKEAASHEPNLLKRIWVKSKKRVKEGATRAWLLLLYGRIEPSTPLETAVSKLKKKISANPIKDTYLFEIRAEFTEPRVAAAIANTAAQAFVELSREVTGKRAHELERFVREQKDISERELSELRDRLKHFKREEGITVLNKESELRLESLHRLEDSLTETEGSLREADAKRTKVHAQLQTEAPSLVSSTTINNNPLYRDLKSQLATFEIERVGLLEKYTSSHKEVRSVDSRIEETKKRLEEEVARIVSEESTTPNPVRENLRRESMSLELERESLEARRLALSPAIDRHRHALGRVPEEEKRLSDLELRVKIAESAFTHLSQEYEDTRVNVAKSISEIRVVQEAVPPQYPARPLKLVNGGVSLLVSLLVGVALAFLFEYTNSAIRDIDDAERAVDAPLLAAIPAVSVGSGGDGLLFGSNDFRGGSP